MKRSAAAVVAIAAWTMSVAAQRESQTTGSSFEVASIKRTVPAQRQRTGFLPGPTRFTAIDVPAGALIGFAYRGVMDEMRGAPEWAKDHYDVEAPVAPGTTPDQRALMVRNLLVERFHLAIHFVTEERDVLALVRTRPDATPRGLRAVVADCDAIAAAGRPPQPPPSSERDEMPPCGAFDAGRMIRSGGLPLKYLADRIRIYVGRQVIDDTGLTGNFAFTLKFSPNRQGWPEPTDEYPELATALRDQLELKLVPKKANVNVLVIDRFERPTDD